MKQKDKQTLYIKGGARQLKEIAKKALFGVLFLFMILLPVVDASASLLDEKRAELDSIREDLDVYEAEEQRYASEANTLENKIAALNTEINKIESKIDLTEGKIDEARLKINELNDQIKEKQKELLEQKEILGQAIKYMYEEGETPFVETLFSSDTFSQILDRTEYLNTAQMKVEKAMGEIDAIKQQLKDKRKEQREKKREQQKLRKELQGERNNLSNAISSKQYILNQTKEKESKYQALVAKMQRAEEAAQAEVNRILSSVGSGSYVSHGHVNRGDIVGYMGSTGNSTGVHLHFEVRLNTSFFSHTNPQPYINNGTFMRPVPGPITQPYGYTSFARQGWYGGGPHMGIDYGAYNWGANNPIHAAGSGEIIFRGWLGGYGNAVMILHPSGLVTLYGHMQ